VLASRLPEIAKIVETYRIGDFIENHSPEHIALKINEMLGSEFLQEYRVNTRLAAGELTWAAEKQKLRSVIMSAAGEG
jgi:hypothetical protein